jgi:hypothetical protein
MKQLCVAIFGSLLVGCAYNQSISFLDKNGVLLAPESISIDDRRNEEDKKTRLNVNSKCVRWYGDGFISPDKKSYLKHLVATRTSSSATTRITLNRFETVEYCELSALLAAANAASASAGYISTTSKKTRYQIPPGSRGDVFLLRIAGEVNGRPFDITKGFDYSDIRFLSFPSENAEYRKRLEKSLSEAVDEVVELAKE